MLDKAEKIKRQLLKEQPKKTPLEESDFVSTGSTLLNLACSGKVRGGFAKGLCHLIVGDSNSGKTWLSLTCLAEASINPAFDKYRFIHDNAEGGSLMDLQKYFGPKLFARIEPPAGTKANPEYSSYLKDFYRNIRAAHETKRPYIYVLDSMDTLDDEDTTKQDKKDKAAERSGEDAKGTYGTNKAKENSRRFRTAVNRLKDNGSILIVISQTRQNIGWNAKFQPRTRSGGDALRFYSRIEFWSSAKEKIKRRVNGVDRKIGIVSKINMVKNHICGWEGELEVPIYRSVGIDDLGSCIAWLVEEKHWTGKVLKDGKIKSIDAPEFDFSGSPERLITAIEESEEEWKLRGLVGKVWKDIEEACSIKRKSRYQ